MKRIFFKKFKFKGDKGFTLIELLVVISILGLMSSVVIASTNTSRTKARDAKRIEDMKNIQVALEMYYDNNGYYPWKYAHIGPEDGNSGWSKDEWNSTSLEEDLEQYIKPLPKEESFGHYFYNMISEGKYYGLGCSLENPSNFDLVNNDGGYYNGDNHYYEVGEGPRVCMEYGVDWFHSGATECPPLSP